MWHDVRSTDKFHYIYFSNEIEKNNENMKKMKGKSMKMSETCENFIKNLKNSEDYKKNSEKFRKILWIYEKFCKFSEFIKKL